MTKTLVPKQVQSFDVKTSGVRGFGDYDYLLTARSTEGFHSAPDGTGATATTGISARRFASSR